MSNFIFLKNKIDNLISCLNLISKEHIFEDPDMERIIKCLIRKKHQKGNTFKVGMCYFTWIRAIFIHSWSNVKNNVKKLVSENKFAEADKYWNIFESYQYIESIYSIYWNSLFNKGVKNEN